MILKLTSRKLYVGAGVVKYVIPAIQGGEITLAKSIYPTPSLITVQSTTVLF